MQRLSRNEFDVRFPRRPALREFDGWYHRDLHVDGDAVVSGGVEGSLYIHGGSHVVLTGSVEGSVYVGRKAVLWVEGRIEGRVIVEGAALLNGTCTARGDHSGTIYDPAEPVDSATGAQETQSM